MPNIVDDFGILPQCFYVFFFYATQTIENMSLLHGHLMSTLHVQVGVNGQFLLHIVQPCVVNMPGDRGHVRYTLQIVYH